MNREIAMGGIGDCTITFSDENPEGTIPAAMGSIHLDLNLGNIYLKKLGNDSFGWISSAGSGGGGGSLVDGNYADITVSSGGTQFFINNGAVSYSNIQNVSGPGKLLGRSSPGAGTVEEIPFSAIPLLWGGITGTLSNQTDLQAALTTKANSNHTHVVNDITGFYEAVDDRLNAILVAGSNIVLAYNDVANTMTISSSGTGGGGITDHGGLTGLSDDDHGQYHNDARGDARYTLIGHTHVIADMPGLLEAVDDRMSTTLKAGAGITLTYDDPNQALTIAATGSLSGVSLLDANELHTKGKATQPYVLTDAATIVFNASLSNVFELTLGGNRTMGTPTGMLQGQTINLIIRQDATGGRTITWPTIFTWVGGVPPILSTAPNSVDMVSLQYDQPANKFRGTFLHNFAASGGTGIADHGLLNGLTDDDHPQYLTQARADARYAQLGHTHPIADLTGFYEGIDDRLNAILVAGPGITLAYNDTANTMTIGSPALARRRNGTFNTNVVQTKEFDNTTQRFIGKDKRDWKTYVATENGETVTILNNGCSDLSISCSGTLRWFSGSDVIDSHRRILPVGGVATLTAMDAGVDDWYLFGQGIG